MPARSNAFRDVFNLRGLSPLAVWVPHARAEVAGIHLQHYSMLATLSSPGPPAQHSTALRAVTFVGSGILGGWHNTSA